MQRKSGEFSKVMGSPSEKTAFEWYESHQVTDHLENTEEVERDSIFYQDSAGNWYRSTDSVLVSSPVRENVMDFGSSTQAEGRIVNEVPFRQKVTVCVELMSEADMQTNIIEKGGENTWTSTTLSSVTMQKQRGRLMPSV